MRLQTADQAQVIGDFRQEVKYTGVKSYQSAVNFTILTDKIHRAILYRIAIGNQFNVDYITHMGLYLRYEHLRDDNLTVYAQRLVQ